MEYVWWVSLTGGDRILLNGDEENRYCGQGVFINCGPKPPDASLSVTGKVVYWAGGSDVL